MLKDEPIPEITRIIEKVVPKESKAEEAEEILRSNGYKIKMVTPTLFGKQIDLFKAPKPKEIELVLKDFTIKLKSKSVFIIE